ncbi:Slr0250 protein [Geminocystis sp. NIES-3708]|nr:LptA/OstA family protein [Geminocystis sp. NIES-3708]BAQ60043.1 Slr0250 protein [Geminocystis sp. NIES-3708]
MSAKTKKTIYSSLLAISLISPWLITSNFNFNQVKAQSAIPKQPLTVRSDIQEANSETGVITARGNVYINYPARDLQATSTQAQYFSRERRLVLTGNVYVLQQGNTMRSETMTYLIDEGRFIATPETKQQVESVYLVDETENK